MTIPIRVLEIGLQIYKSTQTCTNRGLHVCRSFCTLFFLQIMNLAWSIERERPERLNNI